MFETEYALRLPGGGWEHFHSSRESEWSHGELHPPFNLIFVCPQCSDVWARVFTAGHDGYPFTRSCLQHGNGSLWIDWNNEHNRHLPRSLLIREFDIATLPDPGAEGDAPRRLGDGQDLFAS